jgi:2,4-dienoyl-CoA reductase-like NADH-dependent reductase (Old Yellow Enzyme family)
MLFAPFRIRNVAFNNRILRSSLGGRVAYYDGTVSPAWVHFEKSFAQAGIAGIISATISVNKTRMSPLEYPTLHDDRFVAPLREAVRDIRAGNDCRYIVQLGDTGGHTHTSLRAQAEDALSASPTFDLLYGYHNRSTAMSREQIAGTIDSFAKAARRVAEAGCDGVEVTAAKGYLIHQFLNPATNRRTDDFGGSVGKRFRLLEEVVKAVRAAVGPDFLFGIRLAAKDFNFLPLNIRLPPVWPPRHYFIGNDLRETTYYARRLEALGVDYLHIDCGFGFPNPKGSPGDFPDQGFKSFVNATRYLSRKAEARAMLFNVFPAVLRKPLFGIGWRFVAAANAEFAAAIRRVVGIPVIANGGFQDRDVIDGALQRGQCDMVAMGRPLLANPDLLDQFRAGANRPAKPCSFCTLCCAQTAVMPLGCYDERRFDSREAMMDQIIAWSSPGVATASKPGGATAMS